MSSGGNGDPGPVVETGWARGSGCEVAGEAICGFGGMDVGAC